MSENLKWAFDEAMRDVYRNALTECNYNARYFHQMLSDRGGVGTAKRLLSGDEFQYGFTKLWECGRLDITMEAEIWDNPKWHRLFTDSELREVERRLSAYGYFRDK